jgi:transcriptional regulator with XRE-family HTH domain
MEGKKFWSYVEPIRQNKNITQKELADSIEIPFRTFQGWLSKGTLPDAISAYRIAQILGVSVEYLVTGVDPAKPDTSVLIRHAQALLDGLEKL